MFGLKSTVERSAERLIEERLYEQVALELQEGNKRAGIWAKALANSNGSEVKAQSLYIQYHVQALKDEMLLDNELSKQFTAPQKQTEEDKEFDDAIAKITEEYEHLNTKDKTSAQKTASGNPLVVFIIFSVIVIIIFKGLVS